MTTGIVSHIQRFSVHDGPGIRTTVFLKGCQMRCAWCHNPETYRGSPELQIFPDRCIGCGVCLERCQRGAHQMVDGRRRFLREKCVGCGRCAETCYARSLVLVGKEMTVDEVLEEVLADRAFYESSDGGITLSGGEPLCQDAFALEILRQSRTLGIQTAMETNLAWPWERVEPFVAHTDLFLVDVKVADDRQHRRWTGVSNRKVLENLQRLDAAGKPLLVRTPVVVGVNATGEQIAEIVELLVPLSQLVTYELLPYHPLGLGKYAGLGLKPPPDFFDVPSASCLAELAEIGRRAGLDVTVAGAKNGAETGRETSRNGGEVEETSEQGE